MSEHAVGSPEWRKERIASAMAYGRRRVARLDMTDTEKANYLAALAEEIPDVIDAEARALLAEGGV